MRERVALLGGRLQVESTPGAGTTLVAEVPVLVTIRVLIVDDHAVVRTGLRRILDAEADIETVGEAPRRRARRLRGDRDARRTSCCST